MLKHQASVQKTKILVNFQVKAMVFPVVINGYESWTVKKPEC